MPNIDKSKVEKQAKEILDKFASALEKVEKESGDKESFVDREEFERHENDRENAADADINFRKRFLDNAPNHDDDFVIAEKGGWK